MFVIDYLTPNSVWDWGDEMPERAYLHWDVEGCTSPSPFSPAIDVCAFAALHYTALWQTQTDIRHLPLRFLHSSVVSLHSCCLCFRLSSSQVSLDGPTTSYQGPNHDRLAELHCLGTISVEQFSCCSTETREDSAHFQETTEGPSVPHLMCWRTEGIFTTARRCCGVFVILALDIKLQTYLL